MKHNEGLLLMAVACVAGLIMQQGVRADVVDSVNFETVPGDVPTRGLQITSQYYPPFSFSLSMGSVPYLGDYGGEHDGWYGPGGWDTLDSAYGDRFGEWFLTYVANEKLCIDFSSPVDAFRGYIMDVDNSEHWVVRALGWSGSTWMELARRDIYAGDPGTGSGRATIFWVNPKDEAIDCIEMELVGTAGGFGIDNLAIVPEPAVLTLLAVGALAMARRKRG